MKIPKTIRGRILKQIIIADDHPIFREGISCLILRAVADAVVSEADHFDTVLNPAQKTAPEMFVLDLNFSGFIATVSIEQLRTNYPTAAIVIVSMQDDAETNEELLDMNIDGFISKAIDPEKIGEAVALVLAGEIVIIGPQDATPLPDDGMQSVLAKLPARSVTVGGCGENQQGNRAGA